MRRLAVTAICLAVLAGTPAAAHAEGGLFGALLNAIGRAIAPAPPRASEPADTPGNLPPDVFGPGSEIRPAEGGPQVAYCVRTCDGRYFPMAKTGGAATPAQMCRAMCPSAATEVYSGSNIENAVSPKGSRYTALANAYVYRERMVDGCTCNKASSVGTASIDYQNDPTLRPGDIVMTEDGPVVFKGAVAPTHKPSDFVPVKESRKVSDSLREKVIAMKVMPTRQAQSRAQRAITAKEAAAALGSAIERKNQALGYAD